MFAGSNAPDLVRPATRLLRLPRVDAPSRTGMGASAFRPKTRGIVNSRCHGPPTRSQRSLEASRLPVYPCNFTHFDSVLSW